MATRPFGNTIEKIHYGRPITTTTSFAIIGHIITYPITLSTIPENGVRINFMEKNEFTKKKIYEKDNIPIAHLLRF